MSTFHISSSGLLQPSDIFRLSTYAAVLLAVYWLTSVVYDLYFGELSKFPGPKLWAFSKIPRTMCMVTGNDATVMPELHKRYGPVVRTGPRQLTYSQGAQAWKDIYGFKRHGQHSLPKDSQFYQKPLNKVDSLITADDQNHARLRKVVSHAFSDHALKLQEPLLKRWAGLMKRKVAEKAVAGQEVDVLKFYNCTTFDIMGDLTFSEGLNLLENSEYSPWVKTIFASVKKTTRIRGFKTYNWLTNWLVEEFLNNSKTLRAKQHQHWKYSSQRVDRRLAKTPDHPDLWSKILEKGQEDGGLSLGEHHSTAALFMVAGTETTASALSGITYYLLKSPQCMQKLVREIRDAFSSFEDVTLESLARLKYLHAVLQEGLRMYPPIPIALPRKTPEGGAVICDQFVPADVSVAVHQFATYRSEENFRAPYEFHPERWLGDEKFASDDLGAVEVFSVGPRNCVGKNLAWHEMRVVLVTMLLHFDLELCPESDDWTSQKIFTLWEKKPLMCKVSCVKA